MDKIRVVRNERAAFVLLSLIVIAWIASVFVSITARGIRTIAFSGNGVLLLGIITGTENDRGIALINSPYSGFSLRKLDRNSWRQLIGYINWYPKVRMKGGKYYSNKFGKVVDVVHYEIVFPFWCLFFLTLLLYARIRKTRLRLNRWTNENRCLNCGYVLEGLGMGKCPECGKAIVLRR